MQITRRNMLGGSAAVAAAALAPNGLKAQSFRNQPQALSQSYPDPAIQILDPSFAKYRIQNAGVERLATGMRWSEGPVWFGDTHSLLWSDIPNNRIMRYDDINNQVSVFRYPSNNANGNTRDRQGRLVTCEHLTRRITRTEYDGSITVLIDKFDGKPLNSPNDVVVKSDDSIWFSDPTSGIQGNYEGRMQQSELPMNVYRLDAKTGRATVVAEGLRPNGLAFSPDEKRIYLVDNNDTPRLIRVYDVVADGTKLANGRIFVTCEPGANADGYRCDIDGNLWCGWGSGPDINGVTVFNPDGKRIGHIALPERAANLCFGGAARNRLFMAASHSLYSVYVNTQGAPGG
jgi:gluconolactonase